MASLNYKPDGDTLKEFLKNKSFFMGKVEFQEIEKIYSIDIDTQEDLDFVRLIMKGVIE